ncbi:MAG: ferric reductase-like transmembrane domain-containing protein, partial [Armatimonadota bacterium]
EIRWPIWALVLMSAGGFLLHVRIHPPGETAFNWIPIVVTLFNIFVLPVLFNHRTTAPAAYALNWATVIVGTVAMAFFSVANPEGEMTFTRFFTHTTFPDIVILAARIPLGEIIIAYWRSTAPDPATAESAELQPVEGPEQPDVPVAEIDDISPAVRAFLQTLFIAVFVALLSVAAWIPLQHYSATLEGLGPLEGNLVMAGRLTAMLAATLIMLQFALAARLRPLDDAFGLDRIMRFHRLTGAAAVTFAILHPILLYVTPHYALGAVGEGIFPEMVGALILTALIVIAVTSIWRKFLNLSYDAWHRIHYLAFAVVVLVVGHSLSLGSDLQSGWARVVWLAMFGAYALLFAWARVIRPRIIAGRRWTVERVAPASHDTWQLDLAPDGHDGIRQMPGQFALLTIHRDDARDERHPFTISSPPRKDGSVSFTIKESGDYTDRIGETPEGASAVVEAPWGQFCHLLHGGERLLMIAGGVGITPILSMLRYMVARGDARPITLIWGNRTEADILYREELARMEERLNLRVVHVLSEQPEYDGETGYVDADLLGRVLNGEVSDADVYLCGPPPMMDLVEDALRELGFDGSAIHSERFEL